jgi:ADP-ribosyl-[dinitrogen reductase] hydrolase
MSGNRYQTFFEVFDHSSRFEGRTSISHPLQIAKVATDSDLGIIEVTFCSGKYQPDSATGSWSRDLPTDIKAISDWGATALVTLIEGHEIETLRAGGLELECRLRSMGYGGRRHSLTLAKRLQHRRSL